MQDLGVRADATLASIARIAAFPIPHWDDVVVRSRNSHFRKRGNPCSTLPRISRIVVSTSTPVLDFPSGPMLAISLFLIRSSFPSVRSYSTSGVERSRAKTRMGRPPIQSVAELALQRVWGAPNFRAYIILVAVYFGPHCYGSHAASGHTSRSARIRKRPLGPRASRASFWTRPSISGRSIFIGRRCAGVSGEGALVSDVSIAIACAALPDGPIGASCSSMSLSVVGGVARLP